MPPDPRRGALHQRGQHRIPRCLARCHPRQEPATTTAHHGTQVHPLVTYSSLTLTSYCTSSSTYPSVVIILLLIASFSPLVTPLPTPCLQRRVDVSGRASQDRRGRQCPQGRGCHLRLRVGTRHGEGSPAPALRGMQRRVCAGLQSRRISADGLPAGRAAPGAAVRLAQRLPQGARQRRQTQGVMYGLLALPLSAPRRRCATPTSRGRGGRPGARLALPPCQLPRTPPQPARPRAAGGCGSLLSVGAQGACGGTGRGRHRGTGWTRVVLKSRLLRTGREEGQRVVLCGTPRPRGGRG